MLFRSLAISRYQLIEVLLVWPWQLMIVLVRLLAKGNDDRCIGFHHDEGEECGCLEAIIQNRAKDREAYDIWQGYRSAVEAADGHGDQDAYDTVWSRAETWVRRHYPNALSFSLDAVVKGERGISATYPPFPDGSIPNYTSAVPEGDGYRKRLWTEGTDLNGHIRPRPRPER